MLEADMKYSSNDIKAGKDSFCSFHPAALLLYFILTIGIPMFVMHPVILMISFISALIYAVYQNGTGGIRRGCLYLFPAALFVVLVNALFQHRGVTVLYYFPSGNPLTLESIAYGFASAGMMVAVMLWFFICSRVMTSDKFVYLFGRVMPVLSLLLSMVLRLIPLFYKQFQNVQEAQRSMGRDFSEGTLIKRMKCAVSSRITAGKRSHIIPLFPKVRARGRNPLRPTRFRRMSSAACVSSRQAAVSVRLVFPRSS